MKDNFYKLFIVFICIIGTNCIFPNITQTQSKSVVNKEVKILQEKIAKLLEKQRDLEARIAVLERLNLTPSPDLLRLSYVRSNRDAITSEIVNIGANAYQYRIRPTTMGGGGGTYEGYKIPKMMATSEYAKFEMTASKDSLILSGVSTKGLGTVRTTLHDTGRTEEWVYTGEFE
jgi:hypothetical protein